MGGRSDGTGASAAGRHGTTPGCHRSRAISCRFAHIGVPAPFPRARGPTIACSDVPAPERIPHCANRPARHPGPDRLPAGPRLHGHVRVLRPARRRGVDRDDPPRARAGRHPAGHRRHLRAAHERAARRAARSPTGATASCSRPSSASCATPTIPPSAASTAGRSTSRQACEDSLRRLGVDHIDLYYQHRVDPDDADRGDGRRDGRARRRGQGPLPRPLGGCAGDDPARARHAPDLGAAERVLDLGARDRGGDPARRCASSASASSPTARSGAAS